MAAHGRGAGAGWRHAGWRLAAMALLGLAMGNVVATTAAPEPTAADGQTGREATATFFNRPVLTFRSTVLERTPSERAEAAQANIRRIVDQPGHAEVSFQPVPQGTVVSLAGQWVALLTPADLDTLHNQTMEQLQRQVAHDLGEAVNAVERETSPRQLLHGALWSLLALALGLAVLVLLARLNRHLDALFEHWFDAHIASMRNEPARHIVNAARTGGRWVLRVASWVFGLLVTEEVLRFVLGRFSFSRPWALAMTEWIAATAAAWLRGFFHAIPGVLAAVLILLMARVVTRTLSLTFRGIQSGRFSLFGIDAQLAEPTRKLTVAAIWLFAVAMAYPYLPGAQTDAFKGLSVLVGLMVSLGASSIVGQAAGGFTLLYSRTMTVGDLVRIGDYEGTVVQIGLFTTRLRTLTGVEVSVPNNVALGGQMENFSRNPEGRGLWLKIGITIGYDTPWRQVQRLLLEGAQATADVQDTPAPYVLQTALSDYYVAYELRARIADPARRERAKAELISHVLDAFNNAGVQIMSPNYVADPEQAKLVPMDQWDPAPPERGDPP